MLPKANRLSRSEDFARTIRRGRRAGSARVVVHCLLTIDDAEPDLSIPAAGFVVSKKVGNAVSRNRVKRRLRHLMRARIAQMPPGRYVVRALPAAGGSDRAALAADLDRALHRCTRSTSTAGAR